MHIMSARKWVTLTAFVVSILAFTPSAIAQDTNAFPFHAEDLASGVRLVTGDHKGGIQTLGKDLSAFRHLGDNRWSCFTADTPADKSQHKNKHHVVYGLPFYALADGEVIGCWRNAPENPAPGELHPAREEDQNGDRFIIAGGNHLWIRHDDGVITLYAHAQPGTIPSELCPHHEALTPRPVGGGGSPDVEPQAFVPPGISPNIPTGSTVMVNGVPTVVTRPLTFKGQKIGNTGHSGQSTGPHLHIHQEKHGVAVDMIFERGLASPVQRINNENHANIDVWHSFAGKALPNDEVLVWPPRSLTAEYARHPFDPHDFSRLFVHLENSGYQPVWFDGYRVDGDIFYNFIWRPSTTKWRMFRGLTSDEFQQKWSAAFEDDFSPVHVESYLKTDGSARYAVIFIKDAEKSVIGHHEATLDQHRTVMDTACESGLSPIVMSVVSIGGDLQYTVLYRCQDIGEWEIHSRIPLEGFQKKFDEMKEKGMAPHYIAAYRHEEKIFYSVIFASKDNGGHVTHHDIDSAEFQNAWKEHLGEGKLTGAVTGYDGAISKHHYVGVWK